MYPDWFPQWALDYCLLNSAMFVTADYRLMPESTGLDIMEDLSNFGRGSEKTLSRNTSVSSNQESRLIYQRFSHMAKAQAEL